MKTSERFDIRPFGKSYSNVYFLNGKGRCLLSQPPEDRRTELNYTSPPKYAKPPSHTPTCPHPTPHPHHITHHTTHITHHTTHITHHTHIITSSHQLIFTHTVINNTTKHSSSTLPKSETTYPLISLPRDEYVVYPSMTNKFFPSICLDMIGQRSSLRHLRSN